MLLIGRLAATLSVLAALTSAAAGSSVRVVDGDTLEVDSERIRLHGVDAPEAGQVCAKRGGGTWPCGKASIAAAERMVAAGVVTCDDRGPDDFGRTLAVCAAGSVDVNRSLVASGMAWAFWRYSDRYGDAEDEARRRRAGTGRLRLNQPGTTGRAVGGWPSRRRQMAARSKATSTARAFASTMHRGRLGTGGQG